MFDKSKFKQILVQLCEQAVETVENEQLEVKGWGKGKGDLVDRVVDAASCLANAQGGILIVGIEEDKWPRKRFSRCPYPEVNPAWLALRVQDNTYPPVNCAPHDLSPLVFEVCAGLLDHYLVDSEQLPSLRR